MCMYCMFEGESGRRRRSNGPKTNNGEFLSFACTREQRTLDHLRVTLRMLDRVENVNQCQKA